MIRADVVKEKIRRMRETADSLRRVLPVSAQGLAANKDLLDLVAFRVYLLMQEAVDLASHVIADQGWGPAPSLRDHFSILGGKGVLPADLAQGMSAGVKVRNLIGHAYVEIDASKLHAAAGVLLGLGDAFAAAVLDFVLAQEPSG